jgi:hypothetical protein
VDVAPGFGYTADQRTWEAFASGEFHIGYGAIVVVVVGLLLLRVSLVLGVLLVIVGTGILVDAVAHQFLH